MSFLDFPRCIAVLFIVLLGCVASGCVSSDLPDEGPDGPTDIEQGLGVSGAAIANSDVAKMEFRVYNCGETTPIVTETSGAEPMMLPDGIEELENTPYDQDSEHAFADRYFLLDAGCYDVEVEPLKSDGQPSAECSIASKQGLTVSDGQTTEYLLVSQCQGQFRGGLDVMATTNHPPRVDGVQFTPAKTVSCPDEVTICVEASDPDDDPMRVEWNIVSGPTPLTQPQVIASNVSNGRLTECVKFKPGIGQWSMEVTVFDQLFVNGVLTDFETYYADNGTPQRSRDSLTFPLYGDPGTCGSSDAGLDAGTDIGGDVAIGLDAGPDTDTDAGVDTGTDAGGDVATGIDTGTDIGLDAGIDTGSDATIGLDAGIDTGSDATIGIDVGTDAGIDVGTDSGMDAGVDTGTDTGMDAGIDAGTDVGADTGFDTGTDAGVDTGMDTGTDAGVDVGTDSGMDTGIDVGADTDTDAGLDVGTDTGLDPGTDTGTDAGDAGVAGCTHSQGYWKNWNAYAKQSHRQIAWPIPGGEDQLMCGETWLDILNTPVRGNSWYNLAHQYIPAKLNEANGASVPAHVQSALATADSLLHGYCANPGTGGQFPSGPVSAQALAIKTLLDNYNNGLEGVPKCP